MNERMLQHQLIRTCKVLNQMPAFQTRVP